MTRSKRPLLVCFSFFWLVTLSLAQDVSYDGEIADSRASDTILCSYNLDPSVVQNAGGLSSGARTTSGSMEDDSMLLRNLLVIGFLSATFSVGLAIIVGTVQNNRGRQHSNSVFLAS